LKLGDEWVHLATGIEQTGSLADWLKELARTGVVVKLFVDEVPDIFKDGTPNPKTVNTDGTPSTKNAINWKMGVQVGDVQ